MSARIIEFIKRVGGGGCETRCEAVSSTLSVFPNELNKFNKASNKFNNTGALVQDSFYHMTLKSHFISKGVGSRLPKKPQHLQRLQYRIFQHA